MGLSSYWRGNLAESNEMNFSAANAAKQQGDPTMLVLTLPHLGLSLAGSGRYAEAEAVFRQSLETGQRFGIETPYARAVAMSAGYHLDLFDYAVAERINHEAQELSRSFDFVPPLISATLDLMFLGARRGEPDSATAMLTEVTDAIERAGGWHGWLWRLRLAQVQAEIAFARGDYDAALDLSQAGWEGSRKHGRRRYQTMALITRSQALRSLGRAREAFGVLQSAAAIARELGDPALLLRCLSCLLIIEPDGLLLDEAQSAAQRVVDNLQDDALRQTFLFSEPVTLIGKLSGDRTFPSVHRPKTPDLLSVRQLEVLRLLAAGMTNHEIAGRLVLSDRTVQRHISDIYAKIDVRNRAEATAYALGNPAIL
jgi:ATP/maltotriose-dependent transcriptional regulator MalT